VSILEEIPAGADARVYAEGWQSWSPTTWYTRDDRPYQPDEGWQQAMRFRPGVEVATDAVQGEGLLVVDPGAAGRVRVFATLDASREVPTFRARWANDRVIPDP
jgi:alpha-galactosidase